MIIQSEIVVLKTTFVRIEYYAIIMSWILITQQNSYSISHYTRSSVAHWLACGAVGLRFNSWQGQEILWDLFCSVSGWHTTPVARRVGLVLEHFPSTNAASQWLYVNSVADSWVGFLWALWFPPTPKNWKSFHISGP